MRKIVRLVPGIMIYGAGFSFFREQEPPLTVNSWPGCVFRATVERRSLKLFARRRVRLPG